MSRGNGKESISQAGHPKKTVGEVLARKKEDGRDLGELGFA